jgi:hypothetical protein
MDLYQIFIKILIICYGASAIVNIVAYWPTIKDLSFDKQDTANLMSYTLWTFSSGISLLYGIFILKDNLLIFISGIIFFANLIVWLLKIRYLKKFNSTH